MHARAQVDSGRRPQTTVSSNVGGRPSREDINSALLQVMADEAKLAQSALQAAESVRAAGAAPLCCGPLLFTVRPAQGMSF